jgi:hypothetical protein
MQLSGNFKLLFLKKLSDNIYAEILHRWSRWVVLSGTIIFFAKLHTTSKEEAELSASNCSNVSLIEAKSRARRELQLDYILVL